MANLNLTDNTKHGDTVILLDLHWRYDENAQLEHIRTLSLMALHQSIERLGIPATTIHYASNWNKEDIIRYIDKWMSKTGTKRPIFAYSSLFGMDIFGSTSNNPENLKLANLIKSTWPDSKQILGGPNPIPTNEPLTKLDAIFNGRALWLMELWLQDKPIPSVNHYVNDYGIDTFFNPTSAIPEDPIVPHLHEDYCLGPQDILSFETRLGCKFNCTFCSYEFRGAKNTKDAQVAHLVEFFEEAKQFGIKRFSCVDDTFNEEHQKVELLHSAVKQLDYQPRIVGFNRFDIMHHYQDQGQMEMFDEMGFHGHFWGIESLHPQASKVVRKRSRTDEFFKLLEKIRDDYPHWWTTGSFITGIPGESVDHAYEMAKRYLGDGLISGYGVHPLMLKKHGENQSDSEADLVKDPAKYGIYLTGKEKPWELLLDWVSEDSSYAEAKKARDRMAKLAFKNGIGIITPWEALCKDALGTPMFTREGKKEFGDKLIEASRQGGEDKILEVTKYFFNEGYNQLIEDYVSRKFKYVDSL